MTIDTIPSRLIEQASRRGNAPAYHTNVDEQWVATSWSTYVDQIHAATHAFVSLGVTRWDTVGIFSPNRPEWGIAHFGAMTAGAIPFGIYATSIQDEYEQILTHAECKVLIVDTMKASQMTLFDKIPSLVAIVVMDLDPSIVDERVLSWNTLLEQGEKDTSFDHDAMIQSFESDHTATLIYTSGTTGTPKGVKLTHHNLTWIANHTVELVEGCSSDRMLSYLPLSHIAEQLLTLLMPTYTGSAVYYADSLETVADDFKTVQPTLIFGVPRIWEKFHEGLFQKMSSATGMKAKLLAWARPIGEQMSQKRLENKTPSLLLTLQYVLANKLIFSKVKDALGFSQTRMFLTGAAPISMEVLEFFSSLDILLQEVYGQTENAGPATWNKIGRGKFGTVGIPLPGTELRISNDGEILISGGHISSGYYKDENATQETLVDGWLHTGDLGSINEKGQLTITGRKKDILVTSGGKNIAPAPLESKIKEHPWIENAVVIGDQRKYLTALITLTPNGLKEDPNKVKSTLDQFIDTMNKSISSYQQIQYFTVLPRNFTVEDGELTPTLKIKRNNVVAHFQKEIDSMYTEEKDSVIVED